MRLDLTGVSQEKNTIAFPSFILGVLKQSGQKKKKKKGEQNWFSY